VVPATATCETKCGTCCGTSCKVQRNVECDVSCVGDCTGSVKGGCDARCSEVKGALFCDGQFVDSGDVQACVDHLRSLGSNVNTDSWTAMGSASGSVNGKSVSCAAAPGTKGAPVTALAGLAVLSFLALRRRARE
jgi:MYXO-CTERM domain-containing protein